MYVIFVQLNGVSLTYYRGDDLRQAQELYLWCKGYYNEVYKYNF